MAERHYFKQLYLNGGSVTNTCEYCGEDLFNRVHCRSCEGPHPFAPHKYETDDEGDQVDLKCRNCGHVKPN